MAGLTSLGAVRLQELLSAAVGSALREPLPATLAFDYPTAGALRSYILGAMDSFIVTGSSADDQRPVQRGSRRHTLVPGAKMASAGSAVIIPRATSVLPNAGAAIAGVDGVGPSTLGGINGLSTLLPELPFDESIGVVPLSRWDLSKLAEDKPGEVPPVFGGFVAGVDMFDAEAAGVSAPEAIAMDPQQRLVLASSIALWATRHGGNRANVSKRSNGRGASYETWATFVGLSQVEYPKLAAAHIGGNGPGPYYATGTHMSVAAGRVAFTLGRVL